MQLMFIHGSGGARESFHYQTEYFTKAIAINLPIHPDTILCSSINDFVDWLPRWRNPPWQESLEGQSCSFGVEE